MRQAKIDQRKIRMMQFGGGDGAVQVVRSRDHSVAGIVLDEIFQRRR